jgi:nucleoside-diphosphate-sugar epimerase
MQISIVGLGWLGEPLAKCLHQNGHGVRGSTTSGVKASRLNKEGIAAKVLRFDPLPVGEDPEFFFDAEVLVINIPPAVKKHGENHYLEQIRAIRECAQLSGVPKIIFISTTSVYPSANSWVSETDLLHPGAGGFLLEAENIFRRDNIRDITLLRLGGLFGGQRIPGKYFANQSGIAGHLLVNYIHRIDAIRLIQWVIQHALWNQTYNGVAPIHPTRREVYERNAAGLGFEKPLAYEDPPLRPWKKVSSQKILQTGFQFVFPDPVDFFYE